MRIVINSFGMVVCACVLSLLPQLSMAQISKPTEEELNAAPPQFQNLVHGRSDKIDQSKPPRPPGPGGTGFFAPAAKAIPNPNSKDAHNLSGYWALNGGPPGVDPGGGYPGGGPGSPATDPRVGDVVHSEVDANRMCLVALGVNPSPMKVYQNEHQLTWVYGDSLHARRIYFASAHTPHAKPSYNGDSIAHWDGNTLVVDTIAIKGVITLLDADLEKGVHSLLLARPTLHVVERITRSADGEQLTDEATWTDPSDSSKKPVVRTAQYTYTDDITTYDFECEDIGDRFGPNYGGGAK